MADFGQSNFGQSIFGHRVFLVLLCYGWFWCVLLFCVVVFCFFVLLCVVAVCFHVVVLLLLRVCVCVCVRVCLCGGCVVGRRGSHTTARELQTCTFEGPGASNTTKIPRKRPKEREKRIKNCGGRGKKSAKFWAPHPSGPHPSGPPPFGAPPSGPPTLRGPHFFWVCPPTLCGPTMTPKIGQGLVKLGWPKRDWPKSVPSYSRGAFLCSAHCSFHNISLRSVWCGRAMIPWKIFTSFSEFQGIVSVNDFWFPLGFQELLQASLGFLWSLIFARIRLDPLGGQILHHDCVSMIVSKLEIVAWDLVVCCYQVTKVHSSRYGFAIASFARSPCNFGPLTDLAISVFREMSVNIVLTQILTSLFSQL